MYHHLKSTGGSGGFGSKDMSWTTFFENIVIGKVPFYEGWFRFEKEMIAAQRGKYGRFIHSLQYEQLKQNPVHEIKRIADFLEVKYSDDTIADIAEKCSFEKLKNVRKTVPEDFKTKVQEIIEKMKQEQIPQPKIFRKGVIGDWKNHFTVAQHERFDELYENEMKDIDIAIIDGTP